MEKGGGGGGREGAGPGAALEMEKGGGGGGLGWGWRVDRISRSSCDLLLKGGVGFLITKGDNPNNRSLWADSDETRAQQSHHSVALWRVQFVGTPRPEMTRPPDGLLNRLLWALCDVTPLKPETGSLLFSRALDRSSELQWWSGGNSQRGEQYWIGDGFRTGPERNWA